MANVEWLANSCYLFGPAINPFVRYNFQGKATICRWLQAYDCVPETAVAATADTLHYMLLDLPPDILQRLVQTDADIAIIGRDQVVSDMPPHCHLKGEACAVGERTFDHGTRGVGGNAGCPTCSVGMQHCTSRAGQQAEHCQYMPADVCLQGFVSTQLWKHVTEKVHPDKARPSALADVMPTL